MYHYPMGCVVTIGTDCPFISHSHFLLAKRKLSSIPIQGKMSSCWAWKMIILSELGQFCSSMPVICLEMNGWSGSTQRNVKWSKSWARLCAGVVLVKVLSPFPPSWFVCCSARMNPMMQSQNSWMRGKGRVGKKVSENLTELAAPALRLPTLTLLVKHPYSLSHCEGNFCYSWLSTF